MTDDLPARRRLLRAAAATPLLALGAQAAAQAPATARPFVPEVGQSGKDVIWVPTPEGLVERMLRMAQVTSQDRVVDLGSGDGRIVIAAARRFQARALGIEYNPKMVELARANAQKEGVTGLAQFREGDIFRENFSDATVVTMYLLSALNMRLRPTLLAMKPGTRCVSHQFEMGEWEPDEVSWVEGRPGYLWVVPANAGGGWRMTVRDARNAAPFDLTFEQTFQKVKGSARLGQVEAGVRQARLAGERLVFDLLDADGQLRTFDGLVRGDRFEGSVSVAGQPAGAFTAVRNGAAPPLRTGGRAPDGSPG